MRKLLFAAPLMAAIAATALPAAAWTDDAGERLVSPDLPGFTVSYAAANETQSIREELPEGETTQKWSRLVTSQRFTGLAAQIAPAKYAKRIVASMSRRCPKSQVTDRHSFEIADRKAYRFQIDCPRGASGKAETFLVLAVAGASDMHVKQIALRGLTVDTAVPWGKAFLKATTFCEAGSTQGVCQP